MGEASKDEQLFNVTAERDAWKAQCESARRTAANAHHDAMQSIDPVYANMLAMRDAEIERLRGIIAAHEHSGYRPAESVRLRHAEPMRPQQIEKDDLPL